MTTTHRITTTAAALLSLAAAAAPTAGARPAYDPPTAGQQNASPPATYDGATGRAAALRSLGQRERQHVGAISALDGKQLAAGVGVAPPVANKADAPLAAVRVQTPQNGFDWGDAGIGAAGGLALAMLGVGGGLVISHQRPRRARPTGTLPN